MRVGTFNLLHGRSVEHGTVDGSLLQAAAGELDADVLAIQEVDRGQPRSHGVDQTAVVAEALRAEHSRFVPTLDGTPDGDWTAARGMDDSTSNGPAYGIGLVSRIPIVQWHVRRFRPAPIGMPLLVPGSKSLAPMDDEPRAALAAVLETARGPITVLSMHLSFVPGWNIAQLRTAVQWAHAFPGPRLLLGDLNLPGAVPRLTSRWSAAARFRTYPSWRPRVQFDHVLLDGMAARPGSARAVRLPVSDHLAVVVEVAHRSSSSHW